MELKKLKLKDIPLRLRYQATIIIEAKTPLVIGSGDKDLLLDNPIIRDAFDLPYIPATSLAGVLRHTLPLDKTLIKSLFGYQEASEDDGAGSRLIFSSAHLLGENKEVADGLEMADKLQADIKSWLVFPSRDHVRINHKGVADKTAHGKYESQLLMRGVRFAFDIELWGNEGDAQNWDAILAAFASPLFRIGAGTRKGFGELEIVEIWAKTFDLSDKTDVAAYLAKTTQVQIPNTAQGFAKAAKTTPKSDNFIHYQLTLTPRDFFLFDGQFDPEDSLSRAINAADKLANMTPKTEKILTWKNDKPTLSNYKWLIPATSVKGAIAHRVAFHYNKKTGNVATIDSQNADSFAEIQTYINQLNTANLSEEAAKEAKKKIAKYLTQLDGDDEVQSLVGEKNAAVLALFGQAAKEVKGENKNEGQRGRVIFSDVYLAKPDNTKIFNHVKIDRYTGGAIDTALFTEKVAVREKEFVLNIYVEKAAFAGENDNIKAAFELALADICHEQLPLGGGVMRGHGMMKGSFTIDDKPYKNQ
jgi:CRISPR/Cas system CSM-associated protein Csm3 (group 7 of RAMP superfamily)